MQVTDRVRSRLTELMKLPATLLEYTNVTLTTRDFAVGASAKEVIWTYRKATLFRYRSNRRTHQVPILLTFALINRPDIFDLRPGNSFVESLLDAGFDVYLLDWGYADEEDSDTGLDDYALEFIPRAIREVRRSSGADEISLVGWCVGAALTGMYLAVHPDAPVRNWIPLTMPFDISNSIYETLLGHEELNVEWLEERADYLPGIYIDIVNKLLKPVPNFVGTPLNLFRQVQGGTVDRAAYQSMSKWVGDNPNFPMRAFRQWVMWVYRDNRLSRGRVRLRGHRVDFSAIRQSALVVTASKDHIAPREGTLPLLDLLTHPDVEHLDGRGGHIGLMAGSRAREDVWPRIIDWLGQRSGARTETSE